MMWETVKLLALSAFWMTTITTYQTIGSILNSSRDLNILHALWNLHVLDTIGNLVLDAVWDLILKALSLVLRVDCWVVDGVSAKC